MEDQGEFWKLFENSELDDRLAIVESILEGHQEVSDEDLFEMVSRLVGPLRQTDQIEALDGLLDWLEEERPEFARQERWWFLLWRTENALHGDREHFTERFDELIMLAHENLVSWFLFLDRCRYHEEVEDAILSGTEFYREHREAPGLSDALRQRFAEITLQLILAEHRARELAGEADPEELEEDLEEELTVFEIPPEMRASNLLDPRKNWAEEIWVPEEFSLSGSGWETVKAHLFYLTVTFSGWLIEKQGWGPHRAELARGELEEYLLTPGEEDEEELLELDAEDLLLPGIEFASEQLREGLDPSNPEPHRVAALYLGLQLWPAFLEERDLVEQERTRAFSTAFQAELGDLPEQILALAEDPQLFD